MSKTLKERIYLKNEPSLLLDCPSDLLAFITENESLDANIHVQAKETHYNFLMLFVIDKASLAARFPELTKYARQNTVLWIAYPKKTSALSADLNMMSSWDELSDFGYCPVASVAIDKDWSAIRFKLCNQVKRSEHSNESIADKYAEYIDIKTKKITLPPYMADSFSNQPFARERFNKLSYTQKKEYIMSILTAKQESTRQRRMEKIFNALENIPL